AKVLKSDSGLVPEKARKDPEAFIDERVKLMQESEAAAMKLYHPEALRKEFGMDAEKYLAYYTENLEYLRPEESDGTRITGFLVDDDAKSVGTSNRRVGSLEKWISMLDRKDNSEVALRLLKRYTQEDFDTADKWRGWHSQNRERLFFSDVGGFKFFVGPGK